MEFTAKDVQALREKTGCGMMDCKKALVETNGDMDAAVDYLREKGLASQAKKADRVAAEGTVCVIVKGNTGAILEMNAETDFVAGGEPFMGLANRITNIVVDQNPADMDALLACSEDGQTVEEMVQELFLSLRENMKIRRFARFEGTLASYVHAGGKIGVMVEFETDCDTASAEFATMGKGVAMQVAAMNPLYLDEASVPADVIDKEKKILIAQMQEDPKMAGKPEAVLAKIVDGKISKYYKENCLVDQQFFMDGEVTIGKYVANVAKSMGGSIKIKGFTRYERGEGIQKREDNFADEVANMVK